MKSEKNRAGSRAFRLLTSLMAVMALVLSLAGTAFASEQAGTETPAAEKNGDIMILYTSDIHCGIDRGFGLAGLQQVRDTLEAQGYTTILVDDGDAIQGEAIGTISKGEDMVELMNDLHYDAAIPGNHEFDYGMDRFLELAEKAEYPYISCNFTKEGKTVFPSYLIKEACGKKIAFVGVTTPKTITSSTPSYFQNEKGEYIYSFQEDETGEALYTAVQKAVDDARAAGADYVYAMGHLGNEEVCHPWTYADVISHTNGIDVFLDGHSHDLDQVVMKNKDGKEVVRSACGTKLQAIGYSHISAEDGIVDTNIWSWPNTVSAPELLGIRNRVGDRVSEEIAELQKELGQEIAESAVLLTIDDPVEKNSDGSPVLVVRRAETNLGDLAADAVRVRTGAQIGITNGGGIRRELPKGRITNGDVLTTLPFQSKTCVIEATGQQILDALEWGSHALPDEFGGFLHVSGLTYEIDTRISSGCKTDSAKLLTGIEGERRVRNVRVGDEQLDPQKTYTVAGSEYVLLEKGDGQTAFANAKKIQGGLLDSQVLIDYLREDLEGKIGEAYADPYGQGRIKIIDEED